MGIIWIIVFSFALVVNEMNNRKGGCGNVNSLKLMLVNRPLAERCQEEPRNLDELPKTILKLALSTPLHPAEKNFAQFFLSIMNDTASPLPI